MAAADPPRTVTVTVDADCCAASAMCVKTAPGIFELEDDADFATVRHAILDDDNLIELAREAEASCPTAAIEVSG